MIHSLATAAFKWILNGTCNGWCTQEFYFAFVERNFWHVFKFVTDTRGQANVSSLYKTLAPTFDILCCLIFVHCGILDAIVDVSCINHHIRIQDVWKYRVVSCRKQRQAEVVVTLQMHGGRNVTMQGVLFKFTQSYILQA